MDDIANVFTYFAGLADKDGGEMINSPIPNTESKVVKEPVGVVTNHTLELSITSSLMEDRTSISNRMFTRYETAKLRH